MCTYVESVVNREALTRYVEDDSAKPRLRFPTRERFQLYIDM